MVDEVKEEAPEHAAAGAFPNGFAAHHHACFAIPVGVADGCDLGCDAVGCGLERGCCFGGSREDGLVGWVVVE